jgi:hypothetical protein
VCFDLFIWTQELLCEKSRSRQTNRARRKEDGLDHLEKKETKELREREREKKRLFRGIQHPISMAQEREREREKAPCFSAFANTKGVEP